MTPSTVPADTPGACTVGADGIDGMSTLASPSAVLTQVPRLPQTASIKGRFRPSGSWGSSGSPPLATRLALRSEYQ